LAFDLLEIAPERSETWVSIALYYDSKGKKEIALSHIEKVF
jgi:hypothetical protein